MGTVKDREERVPPAEIQTLFTESVIGLAAPSLPGYFWECSALRTPSTRDEERK